MEIVYIGLGSNLSDPPSQLRSALREIAHIPVTRLLSVSRFYVTQPWGRTDQAEFVNAVAKLETALSPRGLLDALLDVERSAGRERGAERWGPRILDLDILLFGQHQIDEPALHVPHPHLRERAFAVMPLAEIAPSLRLPDGDSIGDILARLDISTCVPLESDAIVTK